MLHVFIQASLCLFWHVFKFGNKSCSLQVFHFFFDLFQCYWIILQSLDHPLILFIGSCSIISHRVNIERLEREGAGEESGFTIFPFYKLYQLLHCLLFNEVVVGGRIYLPDVSACPTFSTLITLYRHMDIISVYTILTYIYNTFHCFLSQLIIRMC